MCTCVPVHIVSSLLPGIFQLATKREEIIQKQEEELKAKRKYVYKAEPEDVAPKTYKKGVGKYINPTAV